MSATLNEHNLLADWLNAQIFISDFRPLELGEFVQFEDGKITSISGEHSRQLDTKFMVKGDSKGLIGYGNLKFNVNY